MPGRCAGWMGQWDKIENRARALDLEFLADDSVESFDGDELSDSQFADWNCETWTQDLELVVHPR